MTGRASLEHMACSQYTVIIRTGIKRTFPVHPGYRPPRIMDRRPISITREKDYKSSSRLKMKALSLRPGRRHSRSDVPWPQTNGLNSFAPKISSGTPERTPMCRSRRNRISKGRYSYWQWQAAGQARQPRPALSRQWALSSLPSRKRSAAFASAALRQQRREHGAPFFRQPESHRAE